MLSDRELDAIFSALSHPIRRRVVALLAAHRSMSYSEILRAVGVESSVLSFHLRKLGGLVEKRGDGSYTLTPLGEEAARILRCSSGEGGGEAGLVIGSRAVVLVDEDLLLEGYRAGGLSIRRAGVVVIAPGVSGTLLRRALRFVEAVALYTPKDLVGVVAARSSAEAIVPYRGKAPVDVSRPQQVIEDLAKRGFVAASRRVREVLEKGL